MAGIRVAIQGVGSVGGGVARYLADAGAKLTLADVDSGRADQLASELGGAAVSCDDILAADVDIICPCALGAILTEQSVGAIKAKVVAGGANNQLATGSEGRMLLERGILYAPDYVINAGGIINVLRHIDQADDEQINARIDLIPGRLESIWAESEASGLPADEVADRMARNIIGR